jgi:peptidoglycan/xylan/chitin deacetylase (PgdA/CDA1 family)
MYNLTPIQPFSTMRITKVFTFLFIVFSIHAAAQQKQVCITVDDLPVVSYGNHTQEILKEVTSKFVATFDQYAIPAIGYVNEKKLYVDDLVNQDKVSLLVSWLEAGYELGNHTYAHPSYHRVTFDEFTKGVIKGAAITRPLSIEHGQDIKYFRHPYLHIGNTKAAADSLHRFLQREGYIEAPVTIDPDDYLFARVYQKARNSEDHESALKVADAYLEHMENKIVFYEKVSEQLFGRNIAQTLLIHANLLNADYLDEIAELFSKKGYVFVSQQDVLKDPLYKTPVTKFGNWGISWMDRWAISQERYDLLKSDPQVPEFITKGK